MRIMRVMISIGLMTMLCASHVWAQLGGGIVYDPTNWQENLATAISTAEMLRLYTRDLELLEDFAQYSEIIGQAANLAQNILVLSQRLLGRYGRWTALIPGGEYIPCTVAMLIDWSRRYDLDTKESIFDGGLAQTLASEGATVLNSIPAILGVARTITGTVSGNQSLHSLLAQLLRSFTISASMRAPMDEAESRVRMRGLVSQEAAQIIADNQYAGLELREKRTCLPVPGM